MQMAFGSVLKVNRIHRTARNILQYLLNNHRTGQAITRELVIRQVAFSSERHRQRPATSTYMSWLYRSKNAASALCFVKHSEQVLLTLPASGLGSESARSSNTPTGRGTDPATQHAGTG